MDFHSLASERALLPRIGRRVLGGVLLCRFLTKLLAPDHRGWFPACRNWVQKGLAPDHEAVAKMLVELVPGLTARILKAHLHLAALVLSLTVSRPIPSDVILPIASYCERPLRSLLDLAEELRSPGSTLREAVRSQHVMVLHEDCPLILHLELVRSGCGVLCPHPSMIFLELNELDLGEIAFCAAVSNRGDLDPAARFLEEIPLFVRSSFRKDHGHRIRSIVISNQQIPKFQGQLAHPSKSHIHMDRYSGIRVLQAGGVRAAALMIRLDPLQRFLDCGYPVAAGYGRF